MSIVTDLNLLRRTCAVDNRPMPVAYAITEEEVADVAVELWKLHNGSSVKTRDISVQEVTRSLLGPGINLLGTRICVGKLERGAAHG